MLYIRNKELGQWRNELTHLLPYKIVSIVDYPTGPESEINTQNIGTKWHVYILEQPHFFYSRVVLMFESNSSWFNMKMSKMFLVDFKVSSG